MRREVIPTALLLDRILSPEACNNTCLYTQTSLAEPHRSNWLLMHENTGEYLGGNVALSITFGVAFCITAIPIYMARFASEVGVNNVFVVARIRIGYRHPNI